MGFRFACQLSKLGYLFSIKGVNMNDRIITLDQLPDDPLTMPPPYWRSGCAIFLALDALMDLPKLLSKLIKVYERTEINLDKYFKKHPKEPNDDNESDEFAEICNNLWELEHKIKIKAELAIIMSAIIAEEHVNRFCLFHLHKDIIESIENLSPPKKLLLASTVVGDKSVKSTTIYEAINKLSKWRNAFVHGHCVDRPTKSLRHNHLIPPSQYPGVPDTLAKMQELIGCFLKIEKYLKSISLNPYTAGISFEIEEMQKYLKKISVYKFKVSADSNNIYDIKYDKK